MKQPRVYVSAGFVIMLGILIYLDGGALFWAAVGAATLHELGHYAAMRLLGCQLRTLRLTAAGAEMELSSRQAVSYPAEVVITLAGPLVNLVCALVCANLPETVELRYLLAGVHLSLGVFNCLPIAPLDGGNLLRVGLVMLLGDGKGERVARWISLALSAGLLAAGCVLFLLSRTQISLLVTAFWLFSRNIIR